MKFIINLIREFIFIWTSVLFFCNRSRLTQPSTAQNRLLANNWRKTDIWLKNGMSTKNRPKMAQKLPNKHNLLSRILSVAQKLSKNWQ
jgi:hypothetical protein